MGKWKEYIPDQGYGLTRRRSILFEELTRSDNYRFSKQHLKQKQNASEDLGTNTVTAQQCPNNARKSSSLHMET